MKTHGNCIEIFQQARLSFSIRRAQMCGNTQQRWRHSQPPSGTFHKLSNDGIVVCSQTFALFWLRKTTVPVKIFQFFHVFTCACTTVISSIFGKSFHFPFLYFVLFVIRYFLFHVVKISNNLSLGTIQPINLFHTVIYLWSVMALAANIWKMWQKSQKTLASLAEISQMEIMKGNPVFCQHTAFFCCRHEVDDFGSWSRPYRLSADTPNKTYTRFFQPSSSNFFGPNIAVNIICTFAFYLHSANAAPTLRRAFASLKCFGSAKGCYWTWDGERWGRQRWVLVNVNVRTWLEGKLYVVWNSQWMFSRSLCIMRINSFLEKKFGVIWCELVLISQSSRSHRWTVAHSSTSRASDWFL